MLPNYAIKTFHYGSLIHFIKANNSSRETKSLRFNSMLLKKPYKKYCATAFSVLIHQIDKEGGGINF